MSKLRVNEITDLNDNLLWNVTEGVGGAPVSTASGDQTLNEALQSRVIYVDTIADLQALDTSELVDGQQVQVREYSAGMGVGGGEFYWDAASTEEGDGGTVFGDAAQGRWLRRLYDYVIPDFFGQSDHQNLQSAFDSGMKVRLMEKEYIVTAPLTISNSNVFIDLSSGVLKYSGLDDNVLLLTVTGNYVTISNPTIDMGGISGSGIRVDGAQGLKILGEFLFVNGNSSLNATGALSSRNNPKDMYVERIKVDGCIGGERAVSLQGINGFHIGSIIIRNSERGSVSVVQCEDWHIGVIDTKDCLESCYFGFGTKRGEVDHIRHVSDAETAFGSAKFSRGVEDVVIKYIDTENRCPVAAFVSQGAIRCKILKGRIVNRFSGGSGMDIGNHPGDTGLAPITSEDLIVGDVYVEGAIGVRLRGGTGSKFLKGFSCIGRTRNGFVPYDGVELYMDGAIIQTLSTAENSSSEGAALGTSSSLDSATKLVLRNSRFISDVSWAIIATGSGVEWDVSNIWVTRGNSGNTSFFANSGRVVNVTSEGPTSTALNVGSGVEEINTQHIAGVVPQSPLYR